MAQFGKGSFGRNSFWLKQVGCSECPRKEGESLFAEGSRQTRLHLESGWDVLRKHHERWLLSVAFHAFGAARQVVWRRTPDSRDDRTSRGRVAGWQWLWRKKVVSLWRRATGLSQRDRLREDQEAQLGHHRSSIWELQECVERLHGRRVDINSLLQSERARVQELESELGSCQGQVKELQRTLKERYVHFAEGC